MSESPTEHFEHAEHAEHVAHSHDPFLAKVSITIAILAVLSAAVGSLETLETADTIRDKTTAAIIQNRATDEWGQFSRESLKKTMYDIAVLTPGADPAASTAKSADYESRSSETKRRAEELEHKVAEANEGSEKHERRHQILTVSATLLHIAIAIATIAIVMQGKRWPYRTAVVLGILGSIGAALAFV